MGDRKGTKSSTTDTPVTGKKEFVDVALAFIENNVKIIFSIAGLIVLIAGAVSATQYFEHQSRAKSQGQLALIEIELERKQSDIQKAYQDYQKEKKDKKAADGPDAPSEKGDFDKDFKTIADRLMNFAKENKSNTAGAVASLRTIGLYAEFEKDAEIVDFVKEILGGPMKDELAFALLGLRAGTVLADHGACGEAISAWDKVNQMKEGKQFSKDLKLKKALCLEETGQKEEALALLKEIQSGEDAISKKAASILRLYQ